MGRVEKFKGEARAASERRGHEMGRFRRRDFWGTPYAACGSCGMEVDVVPNPAPNETNVFGEAVAVDCGGE